MQRSNLACALVLVACGGRSVTEADTDGATEGTGGSESSGAATATMTTTSTTATSMSTTDATSSTSSTTDDPTGSTSVADTSTGEPGTGCCEVHDAAGCEEEAVAACVCDEAPDCCVFGWEKNCVDLAMNACAATCMGPSESSGSESEGGEPVACDEPVQIELGAEDAVLGGQWELIMSGAGEGMVAAFDETMQDDMGENDTIVWDIDVPCDADWYIWVRGYDFGDSDTFTAMLDGEPDPAAVFELGCTGGGNGYVWQRLNWRDPETGGPCDYVQDPWIAEWSEGAHTFQLGFRESPALARIIVTNDEAFAPM